MRCDRGAAAHLAPGLDDPGGRACVTRGCRCGREGREPGGRCPSAPIEDGSAASVRQCCAVVVSSAVPRRRAHRARLFPPPSSFPGSLTHLASRRRFGEQDPAGSFRGRNQLLHEDAVFFFVCVCAWKVRERGQESGPAARLPPLQQVREGDDAENLDSPVEEGDEFLQARHGDNVKREE